MKIRRTAYISVDQDIIILSSSKLSLSYEKFLLISTNKWDD